MVDQLLDLIQDVGKVLFVVGLLVAVAIGDGNGGYGVAIGVGATGLGLIGLAILIRGFRAEVRRW